MGVMHCLHRVKSVIRGDEVHQTSTQRK